MEFPTREGTDNPGSEYEKEIAGLLALRYTFEPSVQDFWIGTNVDCVGDTDDVVLCITPKNGEKFAYLLQLKHENPVGAGKNFKPTDFTYAMNNVNRDKAKERFSVHKYFKGYQKFKNYLKNVQGEQPEFIEYLRTVKKFAYILYTNRGLEEKLNCLVNTNEDVFLNHLNTTCNSTYYGFKTEDFTCEKDFKDLFKDFLENLYLFPNQINYSGVFDLIKMEIRKQFGVKYKFAKFSFTDVTKRYLEVIKLWTKGCKFENKTKYITLSKSCVLNVVSDILLEPYKYNIEDTKFSHYDCPQKNIWNKLMLRKNISIVYHDDLTIKFLKDYIGTEVKLYIKKQGRYDYWKADVAKFASNAFCEPIQDDQIQLMKICGNTDNDCVTLISVYKLMWFYKNLPLLLKIDEEEEYNDITKILKISQYKLKVIVIISDEDFTCRRIKHVNLFSSLNDLEPSEQLELLNIPVQFQGRISLPLSEITKENMFEYLKCEDIIHILCDDFNVGNKLDFNCECYINRSVLKILIAFEALVEIKNEFFLIEVQNRKECENVLIEKLTSFGVEINNDSMICILDSNTISKNIEKLKRSHDRLHRLLFHEDVLEWKDSTGSVENIAMFQVFDDQHTTKILFDNASNFLNNFDINKFQIISACPGMGKSVSLDYIACKSNACVWILRVILRKIAENDEITEEPSEFFTIYMDKLLDSKDSKVQNKDFSSKVFDDMVESKKVLLLLDGFDEISISDKDQFSNLIENLYKKKYPIIITTRENMKVFLEDRFKVLSIYFKFLNLDEQKQYLTSFFKLNVPVKNKNANPILLDFVEQLLNAAEHNLSDRDQEFTGIPLQLQLLAKNFLEECKKSIKAKKVCLTTKFDLIDLYDKFIKNKTVILCDKYGPSEKTWLLSLENNKHLLALQYLFDEYQLKGLDIKNDLKQYYAEEERSAQFMQRDGILIAIPMKNKINIDFIHRTFAEYLAAKWLTKNVNMVELKEIIARLIDLRFKNHYKFLFVVFDRILAKKQCPFHLDIINVKVDSIKSKLESNPNIFVETDEINRTAFHLFSLYANDYEEEDLIEIFDNDLLKDLDLDTLDNPTSYSPLDYALFSGSWTFANKLCELSRYLRINTYDISYTFIKDLFYKFKHLYLTVFHNYLCRDLLLGELHEDASILYYTSEFCKKVGLSRDIFKLVKNACTVGEYLKICKIKDTKKYYYHDIRFAIAFGSKENVEKLLAKEVNIHEKDFSNDNTLLHYATIHKRSDIIKILLNKGADVNIPGRDQSTVVHYAARSGCNNILQMYIDKNADLNRKDGSHCTPMSIAIDSKNSHIALTLLNHNAAISDSVLFDVYTVLHIVVEIGNMELLQGFLKKGFDINAKLLNGNTVLHTALVNNRVDVAKILISHNCDFKSDDASESLVHLIAKIGDLELLNLFLDNGLNVNKTNDIGKTPLMIAIQNGHVEFVKLLISNNADVFAEYIYGNVFSLAVSKGNEEIVSLLIEKGCNVNRCDRNGDTPLLIALQEDKLDIVKLLLQKNADVHVQNNFGYTTLHYAAMYGYQDLVLQFLDLGVDINKRTDDVDTALLLALKNNHIAVAKLLILSMPEVNVVNREKCNSLHYAAKFGDITLVQQLISAGAEINLQNDIGWTPLELAISSKKSDIAKFLLSYDGNIPLKPKESYSSILHIAAAAGNDEMIMLCLEKQFDINDQDHRGRTPFLCALEGKKFETASLLIENGADISIKCRNQPEVLHYVARIGYDDLVTSVLEEGFHINEKNSLGDTALCAALLSSNLSTAKLLRSKGAEIDIERRDRSTTMHLAASCGYNDLIMECFEKGYEINSPNFDCDLPIDLAITENKFDSVKLLIVLGAIPSFLTFESYVDMAVQSDLEVEEKIKYFELLLDKFGNVNLCDKEGNTLLHYICYSYFIGNHENECNWDEKFYQEAVKILLELGANYEINNKNGKSAYDLAVAKQLKKILLIFDQKNNAMFIVTPV